MRNIITVMWEDTPYLEIISDIPRIESHFIHPEGWEHPVANIKTYKVHPERITLKSFDEFLRSRLPDPTREDIQRILKKHDVPTFMPYQMCEKSHGITMADFLWLRFNGEQVAYNDIRIR